jgi:hypothetical protein
MNYFWLLSAVFLSIKRPFFKKVPENPHTFIDKVPELGSHNFIKIAFFYKKVPENPHTF